ncbi:MAG: cytochrome c maturation protein CcmE [Bacteroidota bacterium]|nr:cytochrome c maturation protein CcmE [Bacteroidota bacterium]MDP3144147.1 cytochrome c maturation protein CcmE [Bacteroidota bacterium]MDP3558252.1 cytochrome c maturation protein CcmE [Bacteroidota bacterium]
MKKLHIVGIVIIAVAIGVIFVSLKNTSTYADFTEAISNPEKEYHVVGKLDKTQPQIYDPKLNADQFMFTLIDNKGVSKQVVLHKSKPQDFEKSEQIVLIGKIQGNEFHANDILMKCPSKYNDGKPQID